MALFIKGDVVVIPFPFSDLSDQKARPALVLVDLSGQDLMLCQITSKLIFDPYAVPISLGDFADGSLRLDSNIRPNRIFTMDRKLIRYRCGRLVAAKTSEVINRLVSLLNR